MSEEEITKNERLWQEENGKAKDDTPSGTDIRGVGVSSGDIESDLQTGEELEAPPEEAGPEVAGPVGTAPVGTPAAPAPAATQA